MIDQDKMRALVKQLRDRHLLEIHDWDSYLEAADAIDLLLAEVEAANQKRKEAQLDAEKARDERNRVHVKLNAEWIEKTNALRAELEAAAADKQDAERYRWLRDNAQPSYLMMATINADIPSLWKRELVTIDAGSWEALDQHIDATRDVQK